jgi:dynein heavy chain
MTTIGALIVIDVHAKDVTLMMRDTNITDLASFEWVSQLRYYWEEDNCWVK